MTPLWKISSGDFAGWRWNDLLYNSKGVNVGYFVEKVAYSLSGAYIGEIYRNGYVGKRSNVARALRGPRTAHAGIARASYANKAGMAVAGWSDPDF